MTREYLAGATSVVLCALLLGVLPAFAITWAVSHFGGARWDPGVASIAGILGAFLILNQSATACYRLGVRMMLGDRPVTTTGVDEPRRTMGPDAFLGLVAVVGVGGWALLSFAEDKGLGPIGPHLWPMGARVAGVLAELFLLGGVLHLLHASLSGRLHVDDGDSQYLAVPVEMAAAVETPWWLVPLTAAWALLHFAGGISMMLLADRWFLAVWGAQPPEAGRVLFRLAIGFCFAYAANVYLVVAIAQWHRSPSWIALVWRHRIAIDVTAVIGVEWAIRN